MSIGPEYLRTRLNIAQGFRHSNVTDGDSLQVGTMCEITGWAGFHALPCFAFTRFELARRGAILLSGMAGDITSVTEVSCSMSKPADLVQGTLDLLLLKILALEPLHGWAISQRLKQVSGEDLHVSEGSLYPALHKLELAGVITAAWKTSELGRRAKVYSLTAAGRRRLEEETEEWRRLSGAISRVLRLKEA